MMTSNILTLIQTAIGLVAMCFWGVGMYYWHLTNRNLQPGVSIFVLLNPAAYLRSEYFTPAGIKYRRSTITSFAAMMFLALLAFILRTLRETF
jgi:glucose dehydrogenase